MTSEQVEYYDGLIAEQRAEAKRQREAAAAERAQRDAERKEAARAAAEQRKEAARLKREEAARRSAEAKRQAEERVLAKQREAEAIVRQRQADQLRQATERQQAELQRAMQARQLEQLRSTPAPPASAAKQLEAIARGEPPSGVARGTAQPTPKAPLVENRTLPRLESAKRLEPPIEQRKIARPGPAPQQVTVPKPDLSGLHTFMCGTPPNQVRCPSYIEASRQKTAEVYSRLGVQPTSISGRLAERHAKGMEYLRDSPEVRDAIVSIQAKTAGFAAAGHAGLTGAELALLTKSTFEGIKEFREGKHYEGTLRAINEISSAAGEKLGLPPGSSDVINLSGAAATSYLYGFFKGL